MLVVSLKKATITAPASAEHLRVLPFTQAMFVIKFPLLGEGRLHPYCCFEKVLALCLALELFLHRAHWPGLSPW